MQSSSGNVQSFSAARARNSSTAGSFPFRLDERAEAERVLVVDDEFWFRVLKLHFDTRYELIHAPTGTKALAIIQHGPVDLAILEYRLPDFSGLELLGQIKTILPRLPVILITASGSEWVCASALKLGARDYFLKPFDLFDLGDSIRFVLSTVRHQTEARENVLVAKKTINKLRSGRPTAIDRDKLAIQQAARFIQEHYWETVSLSQVAHHVGVSKFVLSRKFKAGMRLSFRGHLLQFRVMKARELLQTNQYSITEVAQMVGFNDLPRFDKVFKSLIGMPPSQYRALSRSEHPEESQKTTNLKQ